LDILKTLISYGTRGGAAVYEKYKFGAAMFDINPRADTGTMNNSPVATLPGEFLMPTNCVSSYKVKWSYTMSLLFNFRLLKVSDHKITIEKIQEPNFSGWDLPVLSCSIYGFVWAIYGSKSPFGGAYFHIAHAKPAKTTVKNHMEHCCGRHHIFS